MTLRMGMHRQKLRGLGFCTAILALAAAGCGGPSQATAGPVGDSTAASSASATPDDPQAQPTSLAGGEPDSAPASAGEPCGELGCLTFPDAPSAFAHVLAQSPRVLAIGEAHALKGTEEIRSTTERFREDLLPMLEGKADKLVVELWVADKKCKPEQVEQTAQAQQPVTQGQADSNQSEFVALGHAANEHGITPYILRPSCEEYQAILDAKDEAVLVMLEMITRLSQEKVIEFLEAATPQSPRTVLAYGGAMHNDVSPREGREDFTFGPALMDYTKGEYVELDLIVPQFIKATDSWKALPWYDHFDPEAHPDRVTLLQPHPGSYVLIFARDAD